MKFDMEHTNEGTISEVNTEDLCILDSGTTHTILKHKKYFSNLKSTNVIINTILGLAYLIEGHEKANFALPNGTKLFINDILFSLKSKRNLLSFNDMYLHGYEIKSLTEGNMKYMNITFDESGKK